jgi:sugar-specific transcriptional regulator TrmB
MKASGIGKKTPLKRGLIYYVLGQLLEIGLVEKDETGKVVSFRSVHPFKLKELAEKNEEKARDAKIALEDVLPRLISQFNLVSGMPGVRFFEGVSGFKKIYDDILETGKDFYLIRSVYEPTYQEKIKPIVHNFVAGRVKKGIRATALTPPRDSRLPVKSDEDDKRELYDRVRLKEGEYTAPVEIDVYGDKLAILSFGKELVGVIIESPQIALAFRDLFLLSKKGAVAGNMSDKKIS